MVAGIVHKCGAAGGEMAGPSQHNKKGMFENSQIRNSVVKPFLRRIACDPLGQKPLPNRTQLIMMADEEGPQLRARVLSILAKQGVFPDSPWFYKGAKMCLMWPLWHAAFPDAQWIFVRRPSEGIIASCLRTPFMRAYRTHDGWQSWVDEHLECRDEMECAGLTVFDVWSDEIVKGSFDVVREVVTNCGLDWCDERVKEFVDPNLYTTPCKT